MISGGEKETTQDEAWEKIGKNRCLQQRMPACQPTYSPYWMIPSFLLFGGAFVAVGAIILQAQADLKSYAPVEYGKKDECKAALQNSPCYTSQFNYTHAGPTNLKPLNPLCVPLAFDDDTTPVEGAGTNVCEVTIALEEDWEGPVYFFYALTNFYQNHRLYVSSRSDNQLTGENHQTYNEGKFTRLKSEMEYEGCKKGTLCTGTTDTSPWLPVDFVDEMGQSKADCEGAAEGAANPGGGVWCPCTSGGTWGPSDSQPCSGLEPAFFDETSILPPNPGESCDAMQPGWPEKEPMEGYGKVDDDAEIKSASGNGGQCWAKFCNPCGLIARSMFTDKFKLRDASGDEVGPAPILAPPLPRARG